MSNLKEEITILTLRDKEKIILPLSIEEYLKIEEEAKANKESWIFIKHLKREINFYNIMDKQWKTRHLSIEAPKKEYKEPTPEERAEFKKFQKEMLEKTYDNRKKRFKIERDTLLKDLAKKELNFKVETTLNKLKELDERRIKEQKEILHNHK